MAVQQVPAMRKIPNMSSSSPAPSCSRFAKRAGSEIPRRRLADLSLTLAEEPFRLFFPLGILASIIGVLLWPLFLIPPTLPQAWQDALPLSLLKGSSLNPYLSHPRIMVEGFLGAFVIGFLGTAGPRMVSAPRFTRAEVVLLAGLLIAMVSLHAAGNIHAGDIFFLLLLGTFTLCLLTRLVLLRKDSPPIPFVLAAGGLFCAISGGWLLLSNPVHVLGRLLVFQGFILLPSIGIGSFLFPRLLGTESQRRPLPPPVGIALAALCAAALVGSFFWEAGGNLPGGYLLRAGAAVTYLFFTVPWRKTSNGPTGTLSKSLIWCCFMAILGLVTVPFGKPEHQMGLLHFLFLGGFGLLALTVASRVLLGHSGQVHLFHNKSNAVRWWTGLIILGVLTRVSANFFPKVTVSHYNYAATLWIIAAIIWTLWQRQRFLCKEEE